MSLYKSVISSDTVEALLNYFNEFDLSFDRASTTFPERQRLCEFPEKIIEETRKEIHTTLSPYFVNFSTGKYFRIYRSEFGTVKPHTDVSINGETHTLLIYLTDDFEGGKLFVKTKRDEKHFQEHGQPEKKHVVNIPEPRVGYGVLFEKKNIHYTDELIGNKIILLIDCLAN